MRAPGGIAYAPNRETTIDIRGDVQTPATVADLLLGPGRVDLERHPTTNAVRLRRRGSCASATSRRSRTTFEPQRVYAYIARLAGDHARRAKGERTRAKCRHPKRCCAQLPELAARSIRTFSSSVLNVQATYTQQQLSGVMRTLIEAIVFTGIVMLFFLRSWRNAVVVMVAIPTSLLVTLAAMRLANFTIDTVSLLAMTLIIGIWSTTRSSSWRTSSVTRTAARSPRSAAVTGRTEIGVAAIVITLVDVVVFLPISFLPGSVGLVLARVRSRRHGRDAHVAVRLVYGDAVARRALVALLELAAVADHRSLRSQGFDSLRRWYVDARARMGRSKTGAPSSSFRSVRSRSRCC